MLIGGRPAWEKQTRRAAAPAGGHPPGANAARHGGRTPWRWGCAVLGAGVLLAGCGGAPRPTMQTLQGSGYRFDAPASWTVTTTASSVSASNGPVERVEVYTFTLEHAYRASLYSKTARELDGVIAKLATQLHARVVSGATTRLEGGPARSYTLDYGHDRTQQIVFVLHAKSEYELLCRRLVTDPSTPCQQLFSSFSLVTKPQE